MEGEKVRILVVDDDPSTTSTLKTLLEGEGCDVSIAETGEKTLELIRERHFDILIIDYMLPDINGLEVTKKVLEIAQDIVPVMITGTSSMELAIESMKIGMQDFLVKPINPDELKKVIIRIIWDRDRLKAGKE